MNFVYANTTSLFDFTNGASNSLLLLLQELASNKHNVHCITSTISDSDEGYQHSKKVWDHYANKTKKRSSLIQRFVDSGVKHSLILTRNRDRGNLSNLEQELLYREAERIITSRESTSCLISWGNLLLEEAFFRLAHENYFITCFYLTNPSFRGRKCWALTNADMVACDSISTLNLYQNEIKHRGFLLPKPLEKSKSQVSIKSRVQSKICLFVNPSIEKGLEPFLHLAKHLNNNYPEISLQCINTTGNLLRDLDILQINIEDLPQNIQFVQPTADKDKLYANARIVLLPSLWHESGSRLIAETRIRGIPLLAFKVGGNAEHLAGTPQDIFELPEIELRQNSIIRIKSWNPNDFIQRIIELLLDDESYIKHSEFIQLQGENLRKISHPSLILEKQIKSTRKYRQDNH